MFSYLWICWSTFRSTQSKGTYLIQLTGLQIINTLLMKSPYLQLTSRQLMNLRCLKNIYLLQTVILLNSLMSSFNSLKTMVSVSFPCLHILPVTAQWRKVGTGIRCRRESFNTQSYESFIRCVMSQVIIGDYESFIMHCCKPDWLQQACGSDI